jgi:hypothetical protein
MKLLFNVILILAIINLIAPIKICSDISLNQNNFEKDSRNLSFMANRFKNKIKKKYQGFFADSTIIEFDIRNNFRNLENYYSKKYVMSTQVAFKHPVQKDTIDFEAYIAESNNLILELEEDNRYDYNVVIVEYTFFTGSLSGKNYFYNIDLMGKKLNLLKTNSFSYE